MATPWCSQSLQMFNTQLWVCASALQRGRWCRPRTLAYTLMECSRSCRAMQGYTVLEAALAGRAWLINDAFSAADIVVGVSVRYLHSLRLLDEARWVVLDARTLVCAIALLCSWP